MGSVDAEWESLVPCHLAESREQLEALSYSPGCCQQELSCRESQGLVLWFSLAQCLLLYPPIKSPRCPTAGAEVLLMGGSRVETGQLAPLSLCNDSFVTPSHTFGFNVASCVVRQPLCLPLSPHVEAFC